MTIPLGKVLSSHLSRASQKSHKSVQSFLRRVCCFVTELFGGDNQLTHVPMNIAKHVKGRWQIVFDGESEQACLMQQVAGADAEHMVLASEVLE